MAPNAPAYGDAKPARQRGRCTSCLCMSWKVFACIFSHVMLISLVIAYCLFGSYAFERLESENERNVSVRGRAAAGRRNPRNVWPVNLGEAFAAFAQPA